MGCLLKFLKCLTICLVIACLALVIIGWCSRLPSLEGRSISTALADTAETRLGRSITPLVDAHPGFSGVYLLPDSRDSLPRAGAWRRRPSARSMSNITSGTTT
jgi:putative cardiolipin synthase